MPVALPVAPGTHAHLGHAAYYRGEADRIDAMAAQSPEGPGRARFEQVAQEYRTLADSLDARHDPDPDDLPGDADDDWG